MKDLFNFIKDAGNGLAEVVGWISIGLVLLSLYPPLSFIPKAFVLYVLTH